MLEVLDYGKIHPVEFWQQRFNETNWPLCGTFRSYLLYQIHNRISEYSRLRKNDDEHMLMMGNFGSFRVTLEQLEADLPIPERIFGMFKKVELLCHSEGRPEGYETMKASVLHLLGHMENARERVSWEREQIHQNFLLILDAQDQDAPDGDIELRAEFNESADILREMLWELKLARDAVLWEGSQVRQEDYFAIAREILVEGGEYEGFRRQYIPHEDPRIFDELRAKLEELEISLEVHALWLKHTR